MTQFKNILNDDNDVGSNNFSDDEEHNNNNNHNGNYSQTRNTHSTSSGSMKHSNTVAGKKFFLFPISKRKNVFLLLKKSSLIGISKIDPTKLKKSNPDSKKPMPKINLNSNFTNQKSNNNNSQDQVIFCFM